MLVKRLAVGYIAKDIYDFSAATRALDELRVALQPDPATVLAQIPNFAIFGSTVGSAASQRSHVGLELRQVVWVNQRRGRSPY